MTTRKKKIDHGKKGIIINYHISRNAFMKNGTLFLLYGYTCDC